MATTKTPKTTKKAATTTAATPAADPMDVLAEDILVQTLHRALVRLGEPARVSEIVRETGDDAITPGLARHALETHKTRFVAVDRRWDITSRYLDKQRPVERTTEELVSLYGASMPVDEAAGELARIYGRSQEHFDEVAPRMMRGARFFAANSTSFGLRAWLLDTSKDAEGDILFYNYLKPEIIAEFEAAAEGADWDADPYDAARRLIAEGSGQPVDNRLIQFFAFRALGGEDFDAVGLYATLAAQPDDVIALANHRWLLVESMEPVRARWRAQADSVADLAAEEFVEAPKDVPALPLEVTGEDLTSLRSYFDGLEDFVLAETLLTDVLEVRAGSPNFDADRDILIGKLRALPDDFLWVGTDRFRAPDTLPPYIGQVPESLQFPVLPRFETADGEILDQTLEDEAFEEGLPDDILSPVAQDVGDQEDGNVTLWPDGVSAQSPWLRLVLKAHHKEIGTFPLAQIPPGFFPTEPNIVELTLSDPAGNSYPVYVDYDVQLVYGLFDLYESIAAESGAVFHLEKTEKPAEFKFVSGNETDSSVFVNSNRYAELVEFRAEVEGGDPISTYDIVRRILDHYRKGCSFLTLLTEVNLVRRTPRRLLASILSSYTAFHQRANRWTFDAKKEPEGFDKRKTPFLLNA